MNYTPTYYFRLVTLLGFAFFFLSTTLQAQKAEEDVLYLKNGWIIRGDITEMETEGKVTIRTQLGNVFVFQMSEVERMTKEKPFQSSGKQERSIYSRKKFSYTNVTEVGLGFSRGSPFPFIRMINGVYIDPRLTVGLGVGYYNIEWETDIIPLVLDVRGEVLKDAVVSPFYYGDVGYSFIARRPTWWISADGGFNYQLGGGIKINSRHRTSYLLSLGYMRQNYQRTTEFWPNGTRFENVRLNRVNFNLGITF